MIVIVLFLIIFIICYFIFNVSPWLCAILIGVSCYGGYRGIRMLRDGIKTMDYPDPDVKNGRKKVAMAIVICLASLVLLVLSIRGFAFFVR